MGFSDSVKRRREELRLSQSEVARRAKISQAAYAKVETGASKTTRAAQQIAAALETTVEALGGSDAARVATSEAQRPDKREHSTTLPRIEFVGADKARIVVDSIVPRSAAMEVMRLLAG